jgi:hypothetical protein
VLELDLPSIFTLLLDRFHPQSMFERISDFSDDMNPPFLSLCDDSNERKRDRPGERGIPTFHRTTALQGAL